MSFASNSLLIGGALFALMAFQKAAAGKTLNFYPADVLKMGFDGFTPMATFGILIQNPSGAKLTVQSLSGNMYSNGILIGNISSFTPVPVYANREVTYLVNVRFSILGIVNDIINAFNGSGWKQTVNIKAFANVDGFGVPINLQYVIG